MKFYKFFNFNLVPYIIIGSLIPDFDLVFAPIIKFFSNSNEPLNNFQNKATHSITFIFFIYLLFQIISEIKKNQKYQEIGIGLSLGIFLHIFTESLLWDSVYLFWPLKLQLNFWNIKNLSVFHSNIFSSSAFFFFRVLAWIIIELALKKNDIEHPGFIPIVIKWKRIEFYLFLTFLLLSILQFSYFNLLFYLLYAPSLIFGIFTIYIMRDIFK
tara:strand:+ start:1641 stop:2279 length:639 start_codon:yes stop_codon:yes gene_type:complete